MRGIQNTEFQENVWKKDNYTFYEINKQLSHEPDKCCAKYEQCIGAQTESQAENGLSMTIFNGKVFFKLCQNCKAFLLYSQLQAKRQIRKPLHPKFNIETS